MSSPLSFEGSFASPGSPPEPGLREVQSGERIQEGRDHEAAAAGEPLDARGPLVMPLGDLPTRMQRQELQDLDPVPVELPRGDNSGALQLIDTSTVASATLHTGAVALGAAQAVFGAAAAKVIAA